MELPYMITLGGVAVGAAIVVATAIRWWFKEKHKLGRTVPFLLSLCYGFIVILSAGSGLSALGLASWLVLWTGNAVGYAALVWGVGGDDYNVTRTQPVFITSGGHVIVLLLTVVLISLWLWAGKVPNWKIGLGITAGILLGLSGSLAGQAAVPLASAVNMLGAGFTRMIS
ncbi:hypothetical protein [Actinacidiphila glaucinigra]|uniref:hypothetical protein n=1 Tax=Actinacidiphila glaucinigra TaxID=235986 RepID=UPI0035DE987B